MPRGSKPGERRGGRQLGTQNKITQDIRDLALKYGPSAIAEAARLSREAESESTRLVAVGIILDRAYGKAPQQIQHGGAEGGPIEFRDVTDEMRARALLAFLARNKITAEGE